MSCSFVCFTIILCNLNHGKSVYEVDVDIRRKGNLGHVQWGVNRHVCFFPVNPIAKGLLTTSADISICSFVIFSLPLEILQLFWAWLNIPEVYLVSHVCACTSGHWKFERQVNVTYCNSSFAKFWMLTNLFVLLMFYVLFYWCFMLICCNWRG